MTNAFKKFLSLGSRPWGFFVTMLWGLTLFCGLHLSFVGLAPAQAQIVRVEEAATALYATFPELPRENQYVRLADNQVAQTNTIFSRLIRYHVFIKRRSPLFRLDWQLTFADYLDKNEAIKIERYPGHNTLVTNPMPQDKRVIASMPLEQRRAVVDKLFEVYNPEITGTPTEQPPPSTTPAEAPEDPQTPGLLLPKPGAADLLAP